jgi:hypothetical protein
VRGFIRDLYLYELRLLRERLRRREFPKHEYYDRVVTVRNRYPVLALRASEWVEGGTPRAFDHDGY